VNHSAPSGPFVMPLGQHPWDIGYSKIVSLWACSIATGPDSSTKNSKHFHLITWISYSENNHRVIDYLKSSFFCVDYQP
jgi:hypothetical protein